MTLPRQIEPLDLAAKGVSLEGSLKLSEMPRLSELLYEHRGEVFIKLKFGYDDRHIRTVCGRIKTKIKLLCQRCLQPISLELDLTVQLGLVTSEAAILQLPENYEPLLIINEEPVSLVTIVEDELLLDLPSVPRHDIEFCSKQQDYVEWQEQDSESTKDNPFKVLKKLMSGDK